MKILKAEDFKSMPWKNGGGTTMELYKDTTDENFNLRLSAAIVKNEGAFSIFPNVKRHLLILEGEGIKLSFKNQTITLNKDSKPFEFSGSDSIYCKLIDGSVLDFNVMINPSWGTALVAKNDPTFFFDGDLNFIYAIDSKTLTLFKENEKPKKQSTNYICIKIVRAD